MEFSKLLQKIRDEKGLTTDEIAKMTDTEKRLLRKYLEGSVVPNLKKTIHILNSLGYRLFVVEENALIDLSEGKE